MASAKGDYFSNDEESSDEGWEEEEEIGSSDLNLLNEGETSSCLFCTEEFRSPEEIFSHCKTNHEFSIGVYKKRFALDCFSYIRLINFIREKKPSSEDIKAITNEDAWRDERFMMPVCKDDVLLFYDIESCESEANDDLNSQEEIICLKVSDYNDLVRQLKDAEARAKTTESIMVAAMSDLKTVKNLAQKHFLSNEDNLNCNQMTFLEDESYFTGYSHFSIHHEMLEDKVRTQAYQKAIANNSKLFQDKVVLDIGCGTGILSLFAAQSGASKCFAIDQSDIIYHAMDIARENKLDHKVNFLKGRMENVDLGIEKVDIIVSEWMGYFLFFECMLDTIVVARDKYLSVNGRILPNRCTLNLAAISDPVQHGKLISFWDDVYGFKMTCMKSEAIKEASIECVDADSIVTSVAMIADVNLETCTSDIIEFSSAFSLRVNHSKPIVALVAYFDTYFDLENMISFSTSPFSMPTHWKQTVFYFETPMPCTTGDLISGEICCRRNQKDPRTLLVFITLGGKKYQYVIQ